MVRFKNRWLLVEFIPTSSDASILSIPDPVKSSPQTNFDGKQIYAALKQSILNHYGDVGWGSVGLSLTVKYYSPVTNICIIRVGRDHHKIARGGVTLLESIEGIKCIPHVIHVSGTIKHAQLAAIAHNREIIARYRAQAKAPVAYRDSYDSYLELSNQEIEALQD
ncbi:hypothetical protein GYMLUDRAFT_76256 [Collybiopsis luxurians FD-317 M1]|uniref:Ribonuclease P/MRP protein subunit POP5 n=1 Tax=Collybiopsis luxurians FD-317 M1 TaxID=944289 RepID=A0A0D0BML5_9AGAR|nr:hypothetical protein GYMLUDRAFT_76256 [Collybiopsis luxurians FD-317 M1]